jgi:hypothetical protein
MSFFFVFVQTGHMILTTKKNRVTYYHELKFLARKFIRLYHERAADQQVSEYN